MPTHMYILTSDPYDSLAFPSSSVVTGEQLWSTEVHLGIEWVVMTVGSDGVGILRLPLGASLRLESIKWYSPSPIFVDPLGQRFT